MVSRAGALWHKEMALEGSSAIRGAVEIGNVIKAKEMFHLACLPTQMVAIEEQTFFLAKKSIIAMFLKLDLE